ncbi:hypothetical protein BN1080_02072 [Planococcus massiliensis]|uniref:Prophage pi2 protein 37 n=1 Tax=Planococcus massiliensis TaxID=1499687 RepID=A0A098ELG1_9BACL|nr:HK97 gp10 family phage protein [Planococcus massiliensis]CEG23128.1 hypothetical protein BN1080_02072 [Planococcus massiliensis]
MANSPNDLTTLLNRQLALYADDIVADVEEAVKEVSQEGVDKLKARSPRFTGSYRKGWRVKKVKKKYVIHNKTDYQLTHLLEKGHAKVGGGRVAPKPHIALVEQELIEELQRRVIEAVDR